MVAPTKEMTVEVHVPGQAVKILGENSILDGGNFLSGLAISVKDIFPE